MATYIADRYRIKKKNIGGGNMASIHLCEDTDADDDSKDSSVIVKMFNKLDIGDEDLQKQVFHREVESLDKLNHNKIVRILDKGYDEEFDAFFIVLEYIQGKNFKEAFNEICEYDYSQKLELMQQVVEGIEYLHKKNIVHRDLKPSNIMLDKTGKVKIIDFGISRLKDTFYGDYTVSMFATKNYSSPEQLLGKVITYQSDIYSLGLIFYEIFTGTIINNCESIDSNILPLNMKKILSKMTKEDPNLRYGTITELKKDIEKEKNLLVQEKYICLGFANSVTKRLAEFGYIENEETTLALKVLEEEFSGKCYMLPQNNNDGKFDGSFSIFGQRFNSHLRIDRYDSRRFSIVGIGFPTADSLITKKEFAYEIPYRVKVRNGIEVYNPKEIDAETLCEEVLDYKIYVEEKKSEEKQEKDIINKWQDILDLERKRINQEKYTLRYNNLKINETDLSLEINIKNNNEYEINYTPDDMLQMTTKDNVNRSLDVGHMREFSNGHMIIDFIPQVDCSNIADSGEISISMRMAEIALDRQRKALKSIKYRENVNPEISEIIFNPLKATSKNNLMLTEKDCKSREIDKSKITSLEKALTADNIFLLQGPPGTGKTTFISELVYQILNGNNKYKGDSDAKILIASQSHVAVDHSLAKIKKLIPNIKMIRIGVFDKLAESSREYTLDIFCREWTKDVIKSCKSAIAEYRKEIKIDDSLQEKNSIITEIENINQEIENLRNELNEVKTEFEKINILDSKWKFVNDKISIMKEMLLVKSSVITEENLLNIINNFTDDLSELNNKLGSIIDESIDLSEKKLELQEKCEKIKYKLEEKDNEVIEWKEILGVSSNEEYIKIKSNIKESIKKNKKKYDKYDKIEKLCKEWQKRVSKGDGLLQESIADATLVGATCLGIASLSDSVESNFDWVIVDEAGKATPAEILVPISLGRKIILVGDHKQLPPVVDEELLKLQDKEKRNIRKEDLELSLFEYLEKNLNEDCKSILDEQYRMNPVIGNLISDLFYEKKLISRTLKEDKTIPLKIYDNKSLIWLSTSSREDKKEERISDSYRNTCEANIIFEQLLEIDKELEELELKKETAIIAGYRYQRDILVKLYESNYKAKLKNMTVEINTVDAFQGRETDIVFYSIVRSNNKGNLGFLKDVRRLNVAFSRARELLVVVGDHQCAQKCLNIKGKENPFVGVIKFIRENNDDCMLKEV